MKRDGKMLYDSKKVNWKALVRSPVKCKEQFIVFKEIY